MKIYAFDVDETLEWSNGPITRAMLGDVAEDGHVLGLCGNWAVVPIAYVRRFMTFIGPMEMTKDAFLRQIKQYWKADEYIMVGNIKGVTGASDDAGAAERAGWRFISEADFAEGDR